MSETCHSLLFRQRGRQLAEVASVSADLPDGPAIPQHFHPEDQLIFASRGGMTLRADQHTWGTNDNEKMLGQAPMGVEEWKANAEQGTGA